MYTHHDEQQLKLAQEIADKLHDRDSFSFHLKMVHIHQESFLRQQLEKVLAMPDHEIRTTRARLYNHLVTKNHYRGGVGY